KIRGVCPPQAHHLLSSFVQRPCCTRSHWPCQIEFSTTQSKTSPLNPNLSSQLLSSIFAGLGINHRNLVCGTAARCSRRPRTSCSVRAPAAPPVPSSQPSFALPPAHTRQVSLSPRPRWP